MKVEKIGFTSALAKSGKTASTNKAAINDSQNKDKLSISENARKLFADVKQQSAIEKQLASVKQSADAQSDGIKTTAACMRIAARLMNGDRVPLKDQRYLQQSSPDLYRQALMFRKPNPKPKDYDSVLEEESDNPARESNDTVSEGGVATSAESSGGADTADASTETE